MIITESELRARFNAGCGAAIRLRASDIVTPAARDFIRSRGVAITYQAPNEGGFREFGRAARVGATEGGYADVRGVVFADRPGCAPHRREDAPAAKGLRRDALRRKLEALPAATLEAQLAAHGEGRFGVVDDLQELLEYAQEVLAAEATGLPPARETILGMGVDMVRTMSHHSMNRGDAARLIPDCRMGRVAGALDRLRASIKETELAAMDAFEMSDGGLERRDLVRALGRLSSAVYILACRLSGGYYGRA